MAIKDKDGKVYKLTGVNPIMRDQADWDKKKMQLINMKSWKSEVVEDERNPVEKFKTDFNVVNISDDLGLFEGPEPPQTEVIKAKDFIDDINQFVKPEPELEIEPEPVAEEPVLSEEPVVLDLDAHAARLIKERGAEYFCAPAIGVKEHRDDLYGSSYKTIQYGDKFLFDAVLIGQSDLQLQFWCVRRLEVNSVVYRKLRQGGERWWRTTSVEPKSGGYLVTATVSDSNPDFS
jgi:hypothetical protein